MMYILKNIRSFYTVLAYSAVGFSAPLMAQQEAESYTHATRYNVAGQITGTIAPDPDGSGPLGYGAVRNTYDGLARLIKTETGELASWFDESVAPKDWSGFDVFATTAYTYDRFGRQSTVRVIGSDDEQAALTHYSYDTENRVLCETKRMNPAAYNALPDSACDLGTAGQFGQDRITRYAYDALDNPTVEWRAWGTDLKQKYKTMTYDGKLLTSLTDANNNRTELEYDAYSRLTKRIYPAKSAPNTVNTSDYNHYRYDGNGNMVWERKRNGGTLSYTYDKNNRMTKKDRAGSSQDVYYKYDLRGLTLHSRFASHTGRGVINQFDGFGRLKQSTNTMGGASRTLRYRYDLNGNRTGITHPDNVAFAYRFDELNRITGVGESSHSSNLLSVSYQANTSRESIQRESGAQTHYHFGPSQRLQAFEQDFSGVLNDLKNSFQYNPANQVIRLQHSNDIYHYFGNDNHVGQYRVNGLNQYTKINSATYGYDANGNLTEDGVTRYQYDVENRLTSISGDKAATFTYDPLGRLFETVINGQRRQFLYDGDALVAEYTSSSTNSPIHRYVHGDQVDEPLVHYNGSAIDPSQQRYLHSDHRGSIIAHSNAAGEIEQTLSYDTYGIPGGDNAGRFGYTGQIWLEELGLFHYKARMYSPTLGRFLQTDPIFYEDQMNMYAYVGNDPMNFVDPSGKYGAFAVWTAPRTITEANRRVNQTVAGLRNISTGADFVSKGALAVAAAGVISGQLQIAAPAAKLSTATGVISAASGATADLMESASVSGETKESFAPTAAGAFAEKALKSAKVAGPIAKSVSIGVETVSTVAEVASDVVEGLEQTSNATDTGSNSANGMSSGNITICSGMGAVAGGC